MNRRRTSWPLRSSLALAVAVSASLVAGRAGAFPEPAKAPVSWELKYQPSLPKRVVVEVPGEPTAKAYWYVTYTVENDSDQDVNFLPTFEWVTNEGKVIRSDKSVSKAVFDKIKASTGNKLLEDGIHIAGTLRQGEDQAKDGVAIWPEPGPRLGDFSIFVTGLSGESTQLTDSNNQPMADKDGKPILLFKTHETDFKLAGDELYPGNDLLTKLGMKWVMR